MKKKISAENFDNLFIVRFGTLGDAVTAIRYSQEANFKYLILSRSVMSFIFGPKNPQQNFFINEFIKDKDINVIYTNIFGLIELAGKWVKKTKFRIRFFMQSNRGIGIILSYTLLKFYLFVLHPVSCRSRISIDKYFIGTQYPKEWSKRKITLPVKRKLQVSIWYDSKQPSKNLNIDSIIQISRIIRTYHNAEIVLYGYNKINIPSKNSKLIVNKTGALSPSEFTNAINKTELAITTDSGPMHFYIDKNIPLVVFKSMRDDIINWIPFLNNICLIFDDEVKCRGCLRDSCKFEVNFCVNSEKNLLNFEEIIKRSSPCSM